MERTKGWQMGSRWDRVAQGETSMFFGQIGFTLVILTCKLKSTRIMKFELPKREGPDYNFIFKPSHSRPQ